MHDYVAIRQDYFSTRGLSPGHLIVLNVASELYSFIEGVLGALNKKEIILKSLTSCSSEPPRFIQNNFLFHVI